MRLIDADRLKELFIFTCTGGGLLGKISNMIIEWACSFVDEMPTIDAVPVVRCKDCERFDVINESVGYCAMWAEGTETDYFCAYGERRTDVCMDKDVLC